MEQRTRSARLLFARHGLMLIGQFEPERKGDQPEGLTIGGHSEPGEMPEKTARREGCEELEVQIEELVCLGVVSKSHKPHDVHVFFVTQFSGDIVPNHDELRLVAWIDPTDPADLNRYAVRPLHRQILAMGVARPDLTTRWIQHQPLGK